LKRQLAVTLALAIAALATHALALAPLQNKQQTSKKVSKDYANRHGPFLFISYAVLCLAAQEGCHVRDGDID
jgi:hypothetical protein